MLFSVFGTLVLVELFVLISPWNYYLYFLESLWVVVNIYLTHEIGTIEPYNSYKIMVWRKVLAAVFMISFDVWILITVAKIAPGYCILILLLSLPLIMYLVAVLFALTLLILLIKVVAESNTTAKNNIKEDKK